MELGNGQVSVKEAKVKGRGSQVLSLCFLLKRMARHWGGSYAPQGISALVEETHKYF